MSSDKHDNLEDEYLQLDAKLEAFFPGGDESALNENELHELTPILNSLRDFQNRYEFIEDLASGAEKKIVLVYDRILGRRVAMAYAHEKQTEADQETFLREARLLAQLVHPYIPPVYNIGIDPDGNSFFTMELLPGDDLHHVLRRLKKGDAKTRNTFPLRERLKIFLKTCDAVEYAHSRNVIHRDLKPGNLKHGSYGEVFVCDWGLARVLTSEFPDAKKTESQISPDTYIDGDIVNELSLSDFIKGTPGYMAPEQTYDSSAATRLSDIYSLGAILYSFLTFELPVNGDNTLELIENTKAGNIIPVAQRKNGHRIPKGLGEVAYKAMSLRPEQRYASANELGEEINRYLNGYAPLAGKLNLFNRMSLFVQRHSETMFIVLAALGLLSVLATTSTLIIHRQKTEAVALRGQAENNLELFIQEQQASTQFGLITDLALNVAYGKPKVNTLRSIKTVLQTELEANNLSEEKRDHLLLLKGSVHFYLEEFNAALRCLEQIKTVTYESENLLMASRDALKIKQDDNILMSEKNLATLLTRRQGYSVPRRVVLTTYQYHILQKPYQPKPHEYLPLAAAVLKTINGYPKDLPLNLSLSSRENGYLLDLSGLDISLLRLPQMGHQLDNVLGPILNIDFLDISHTKIIDITELGGLNAKTIRMVGLSLNAPFFMFSILENMGVEKVIIDTANYSPYLIKDLESRFNVVDEPFDPDMQERQSSMQFQLIDNLLSNVTQGRHQLDTLHAAKTALQTKLAVNNLTEQKRDELLFLKGAVHFYLEEFNAALGSLERIKTFSYNSETLLKASRDAGKIKQDDSRIMSEKDLAMVLNQHENYSVPRSVVLLTYQYHILRKPYQPNPHEYLPLAAVVLKTMNGYIRNDENGPILSNREDGYMLDLSGLDISLLRLPLMGHQLGNVFGPITDIDYLDISHTKIIDITELGGLKTKTIRMVGLSLNDPFLMVNILENMSVKKVIIDKANYPSNLIQELEKRFIVVDEPLER
jgi:serine/threonine protein kinase